MRYLYALSCLVILALAGCTTQRDSLTIATPTFQNKGHEIVYQMVQKVGNYSAWSSKIDVTYTYTYTTPAGKTDITQEKYLFDGELSYGKYLQHERTLPDMPGVIEQGYDGQNYWVKQDGQLIEDEDIVAKAAFNRPTNYYWFLMMPKLLDPGLIYTHVGKQDIYGRMYDVVKVEFEGDGETPTDIYQLYINQASGLVDQFLFTVADYGVMETPLLMHLKYETIDGIMIPTIRRYKKSTWDADENDRPWTEVSWTDIKFGNGFTAADFEA